MLESDKLIAATAKRVVLWDFHDIYNTLQLAKEAGLRLYARYDVKGVSIRANKPGNFTVLKWEVKQASV